MHNINFLIFTISIISLLYGISIGMDYVIMPIFFTQQNISNTCIGVIFTAEMITPLIIMPYLSKIINKYGINKIIIMAIVIRNIALSLIPVADTIVVWLPIMTIFGIGGYTFYSTMQLVINASVDKKKRNLALAIVNVCFSLGMAVGPLVLKILNSNNATTNFNISSLICLFAILPIIIIHKNLPIIDTTANSENNFLLIIKQQPLAIIGGIFADFTFFSLTSFLVLYGISNGLDHDQAASLISCMLGGAIILNIPVGYIADKFDRKQVIIFCGSIIFISSQLLPTAINNLFKVSILFAVWCSALGTLYTSSLAKLGDNFAGSQLVKASACFSLMNCLGAVSGVLLTGFFIDLFGTSGLVYSIGFISLLFIITCLFFKQKLFR